VIYSPFNAGEQVESERCSARPCRRSSARWFRWPGASGAKRSQLEGRRLRWPALGRLSCAPATKLKMIYDARALFPLGWARVARQPGGTHTKVNSKPNKRAHNSIHWPPSPWELNVAQPVRRLIGATRTQHPNNSIQSPQTWNCKLPLPLSISLSRAQLRGEGGLRKLNSLLNQIKFTWRACSRQVGASLGSRKR